MTELEKAAIGDLNAALKRNEELEAEVARLRDAVTYFGSLAARAGLAKFTTKVVDDPNSPHESFDLVIEGTGAPDPSWLVCLKCGVMGGVCLREEAVTHDCEDCAWLRWYWERERAIATLDRIAGMRPKVIREHLAYEREHGVAHPAAAAIRADYAEAHEARKRPEPKRASRD